MGAHAITRPLGLAHPTPLEAAASACADHVHAATCEGKELIGVTCVYCLLHKLLLLLRSFSCNLLHAFYTYHRAP